MATVTPRTLSGFMELLPAPQQQMERMMEILRTTYSRYGFTPLDTPAIEASEVLLAKGGGETEKQIYRFQKGDADLSLRFDLTVPLAKYVALHYNDLAFPFRRYQIGKVYRGERAQRGRFREFYQADIDIIGDGKLDITNEAEIPSIIYQTFTSLGLTRFQIRVNNRKILNGFYAMLGLTEQSGDIMRTVDKLDKIGAGKVRTCLTEDVGLTAEQADEIMRFISITGSNRQVLDALAVYQGRHELFDQGLEELNTVTRYLSAFGVPEENFAVDLTIARGLDYYTGTVYETTLLDHPEIGSICSGGRYDNLAEYYTDKKLPGVGISIGVTRLFYVLGEQGMLNPELPMPEREIDGQSYIGVLDIPALGLSLPIISTWSYPGLQIAPCRYSGSAYLENLVIAGHNYRSHFASLPQLQPGDAVTFTDMDGTVFRYKVDSLETLSPYAISDMTSGGWPLTLFTCTVGGQSRRAIRCDQAE